MQFIITHTFKKKTGRAFHEHILPYFLRETWFQTVLERSISIESLNTEIYYIQFIIFSVNHTHLLQTANISRARAFSFVYSEVQIGHFVQLHFLPCCDVRYDIWFVFNSICFVGVSCFI